MGGYATWRRRTTCPRPRPCQDGRRGPPIAPTPTPKPQDSAPRHALVIEDALTEQTLLATLARRHGFHAVPASDAAAALAALEARTPDVILLDIHLPDMDGLALLARIRQEHLTVPVVVITATSDVAHVEEALNLGAVNFLRKPIRAEEFRFVMRRIARALDEEDGYREALAAIADRRTELSVPGDPALLSRVISFLGRELQHHYPGCADHISDVKLALFEAMANAVEHGNLEIGYEGKAEALAREDGLRDIIEARLGQKPYADRRVHVTICYGRDSVEYTIRDEGQGFDPTSHDIAEALRDTNRLHGRGLALIRHCMDDVAWNPEGNEIRMRRNVAGPRPRPE